MWVTGSVDKDEPTGCWEQEKETVLLAQGDCIYKRSPTWCVLIGLRGEVKKVLEKGVYKKEQHPYCMFMPLKKIRTNTITASFEASADNDVRLDRTQLESLNSIKNKINRFCTRPTFLSPICESAQVTSGHPPPPPLIRPGPSLTGQKANKYPVCPTPAGQRWQTLLLFWRLLLFVVIWLLW